MRLCVLGLLLHSFLLARLVSMPATYRPYSRTMDPTGSSNATSRVPIRIGSDLAEGNEALMIFQGPEGYITPNWYPSKALHGKVVPTWNFAVVHAYGRPEVMREKDWLRRHVTELTAQQERNEAKPWATTDAPDAYIEVMLRGIVGFRFAITRLKGKWKMSQNREAQDRVGVVKGLNARAAGDDLEIAKVVSRRITQSN